MMKTFLVFCVCLFTVGPCIGAEPEQSLAKRLVHCGLIADDLAKSNPKYKDSTSTYLGAAGVLVSDQSVVQMMMDDDRVSPVAKMQQSEKESAIKDCESFLYANMDKIGTAMSQSKKK